MTETLQEQVLNLLKDIYDPEIPVNIVELGLIYRIDIQENDLTIDMTLTNPGCPVAAQFPDVVKTHLQTNLDIENIHINLVWDPPWTPDRMSEAAKLELGLLS